MSRKRTLSEMKDYVCEFQRRAPHCFMVPMMTEYEYVVLRGAMIAPHVDNDVKITRLLLEFILDCGIPHDEYCSWKKYPRFEKMWNGSMEFMEHFNVHGDHACVVYDPPAKPKQTRKKRVWKKRYVYDSE